VPFVRVMSRSRYTSAMSNFRALRDATLKGKKVLVRAGFDVPMEEGRVTDTSRIEAVIPTLRHLLDDGAAVIIIAHQDRPKGKVVPEMSQKPLVPILEKLLGVTVKFAASCVGPETKQMVDALTPGEVLLLENLRFDAREEGNDEGFSKELTSYADVYVNDAFSNAHREHASMVGIPAHIPGYMGLQLEQEVTHLSQVVDSPRSPLTLIISGAKIETKLPVIEFFLEKGDHILLGGAIANTFIAARGFDTGTSLLETAFVPKAQEMMLESEKEGIADIHIPRDAVVAEEPKADAAVLDLPLEDLTVGMAIYDVGRVTAERYCEIVRNSGTVVWNGPLGMYEVEKFAGSSKILANCLREAALNGVTVIVGGGDTIDFHTKYGLDMSAYTFVSTGGGAMLDFVSGKKLPAIEALRVRA